MRIELDQLIAGLPARDVRRFMRESAGFIIRPRTVTKVLGLRENQALRLLRALEREGLIAAQEDFWEATEHGHALTMATAAAPLRRATAERLTEQVIQRAREINRNDELAFRVRWLALFGSCMDGVERPNDVDIACSLKTGFDGEEQRILEDERRVARGRFTNTGEWAAWPKLEVLKKLKAGSHRLSIQEFDSTTLQQFRHRFIFKDDVSE
jgi:hypothetical protein